MIRSSLRFVTRTDTEAGVRAVSVGVFLYIALMLSSVAGVRAQTLPASRPSLATSDVTWTTLGRDENDSMPIGNGDLAANVWTEQNGDIVLLIAKSDAYTEQGALVKLGRIRIHLIPNPLSDGHPFTQVLTLEDGSVSMKSGQSSARVWVDANHPALHLEVHLEHAGTFQAKMEDWRAGKGDTILPIEKDQISWYHFNAKSMYPDVLEKEHLKDTSPVSSDPLLHRCFGAALLGPGLVGGGEQTLKATAPGKDFRLDLVALTERNVQSAPVWKSNLDTLVKEANPVNLQPAWAAHQQWWEQFWNRSWIDVSGNEDAKKVTQGYTIQRYMMAASSRGELPAKFNGGLFTVGHDMAKDGRNTDADHNPDFRAWGDSYWNQNNRLLYWPLVTTGDYDLLQPWFHMYLNALPLATLRAQTYYQHPGALFPETMYFWGLPNLHDFGTDNASNDIQSTWQRYHIQGSLEVALEMLDYYDATGDAAFAKKSLVPFADAVVTFYDRHYPRDAKGKILMAPAQSLETYQLIAVNPTPDIAGLDAVLPRLLALPQQLTTDEQRTAWARTLKELPPIAVGRTMNGKTPPLGQGDPTGTPVILPAEKYGKTSNKENPELYVAFPYRLFGVGKPNLELAQNTFAARRSPQSICWGQDGTEAAVLGLTSVARQVVTSEFTDYGNQRFSWFWYKGNDWIPDLDDGGSGMITLQLMLMQTDGKRIQLLPAWPNDWTADFKLHAPYETTVEGHVEHGHVTKLLVTPLSRAKDVVVVTAK